ncbi:CIC11C00000002888 [Sungouiella intermedia]|uniref:Protein HRI1 n=1 Tax=Sungouiella intermedia TaxID=45354 RepID=A0A1L0DJK6_9ASCO|nr:CIC11C00000002888 [[Candida] intermedia]
MVLSTRVTIQWLPEEADELTSTMVLSTPRDLFTDVRVFKDHYPYKKSSTVEPIEEVFQFVSIGWEEEIKGTNKLRFHTSVNLQEIVKSGRTGKPLEECQAEPDIGAFWPIEGTEDRKETGAMENPATGKVTEYVEVWRSLNPEETAPNEEVREGHWKGDEREVRVRVFDTDSNGFSGRIVRLGNWVQGVLFETGAEYPLSVMRSFYNETSGEWTSLIEYGEREFPNIYKEWEINQEDANGIIWKRVE